MYVRSLTQAMCLSLHTEILYNNGHCPVKLLSFQFYSHKVDRDIFIWSLLIIVVYLVGKYLFYNFLCRVVI